MSSAQSPRSGPIDFEQHASFTRDEYERGYLPAYEELGIAPRRIVRVPVVLPFQLPFPKAATFNFPLGDGSACTISFDDLSPNAVVSAEMIGSPPAVADSRRSRAMLTYATTHEEDVVIHEPEATRVFELMLAKLNTIISAYVVVTKDHRVTHTTKEMLEFASVVTVIDPADWKTLSFGLFLLHLNAPVDKPELDADTLEKVAWFVQVIEDNLNPFLFTEELALSATRELAGGSFGEAVIFAQSSVETFLSILLARAMRSEGAVDTDIDRILEEVGFATRVRREYHTRFGGSWDTARPGTAIGEWFVSTYGLRNRVVHGGYRPTQAEATAAVSAARAFRDYVIGLVLSAASRYPDLQGFFEPPGSTRAGT